MRSRQPPTTRDQDQPSQAPRTRSRLGVILGASAAAVVSAGLVYWIGSQGDPALSGAPPAPVRRAYAPAKPDAGQVVRAYEQLQEIYADQGPSGVASFARSCADSLTSDPGALDFCVAFDIYAASVTGDDELARTWRADAEVRDLALARAALPPAQDPAARLTQIRALARQTSLQDPDLAAAPAQNPGSQGKPPPAKSPSARSTSSARPASVKTTSTRTARQATIEACRRRATAGQRTVCASPALRQADQRLRIAYRRALAAGANPQKLARDQTSFRAAVNAAAPDRVAVERLYYKRTRALETLARSR